MSSFFNNYFFIILALVAGMMMPTQAAINSKLAGYAGSPITAAFLSFAVGTLALFVYMLLTGVPLNSIGLATGAPLVAWIGGFLGAFFVSVMTTVVPRLGGALTFSLAIGGQMLATLLIDHFGVLGIPEKPINLYRVLGAALITVGVILIRQF
ncbi:MAG: DMT family transporter [Acidobacteria bacterium]|nr:DMT family transporter [Acidobacteriota bacterium]